MRTPGVPAMLTAMPVALPSIIARPIMPPLLAFDVIVIGVLIDITPVA
jgi:hypothetical protein